MPSLLPGLGLTTRLRGAAGAGLAVLLAVLLAALLVLQVHGAPAASAATALPTTYQDQSYPVGPSPTEDKPQSKLWFNDGSWWALMRRRPARHDPPAHDHVWVDTGTVVDERQASSRRCAVEGRKLYVASRVTGSARRRPLFLMTSDHGHVRRSGSEDVGPAGQRAISIDRDTRGLWITYTRGSQVWVAHSAVNDDTKWTTPYTNSDSVVTADDISAIVDFNGRIGVMWSDQAHGAMRFAVHVDGASDQLWTPEKVLSGPRLADDHINLKSIAADSTGRVCPAAKTSVGDAGTDLPTDPLIYVSSRGADGTWTSVVAGEVQDKLTRPQLAIDTTNRALYLVMASPDVGGGVGLLQAPVAGQPVVHARQGRPVRQWPASS